MKKRLPLILACCVAGVFGLLVAWCAGVIRPPRPMFHDSYGRGGHGVVPYWIPNTPLADGHGHWLWVDEGDNLLVVQATGTSERGRSHAMVGGRTHTQFRLGSAWDHGREDQYATIPRMEDALVVILPDGRWKSFPLHQRQTAQFFLKTVEEQVGNLLMEAGSLLGAEAKVGYDEFLKGYEPPQPRARDGQ